MPAIHDRDVRGSLRAGLDAAKLLAPAQRLHRVLTRIRWARIIRRADVVDLDYVEAQLGRRVSVRTAVRCYVRHGFRTGFRLNPLFVDVAVGDHLPGTGRVPALVAYLENDPRGLQVSPLWDADAYLRQYPTRADERGGAVGAVWRRRHVESVPLGSQTASANMSWPILRAAIVDAGSAARNGAQQSIDGSGPPGAEELIAVFGLDERDYDESLAEIAAFVDGGGSAAIGVTDAFAEAWVQVALLATTRPAVRAILRPGAPPATVAQELLESSVAEVVALRGPDMSVSPDVTRALLAHAATPAMVAPLWVDADGTVAAAGATREGRLLAGHPVEDARGLSRSRVLVVTHLAGTVLAAPATAISNGLREGDTAAWASREAAANHLPLEVRLDLIARSRTPAPPPLLPPIEDDAVPLLAAAGWLPTDNGPSPRLRRAQRSVRLDDGQTVPVLRWALRTAAPSGPRGEWWGDTHFARGLAAALERLGQEVVIDAFPARHRATTHLDDVTLVLRGPERIDPPPTGRSLLWIISHPDELCAEEINQFDTVFAASAPWARTASSTFGREVRPLLQCTDVTRFRPAGLPRGEEIVFVGTARGVYRPSVVGPVRAGVPVRVFGPDWRGWIPSRAIAGLGVPNADLPCLYESAGVVLNDHWPAMKELGFIANRPYDVVAAGGRVISDHVAGLEEQFDGAVVTYRDTDELIAMLRAPLDALFPADAELRRISALVRARDSFDARAKTMLDVVLGG